VKYERRDLLKIASLVQPAFVARQAWVQKGIRTLLAVAPGLGFFVIKGDPLGVGFAFAALCLSVAYNDQTFRSIHLVSVAGAAAGLMPVAVWLHEYALLYALGFALIGAGAVIVTRSRKLPPRVPIWCLIYVLYQSSELQSLHTAIGFATLMAPAALWTYVVCFRFWPHRSPELAETAKGDPIGVPLHAACAALSMAFAGAAVFAFNLSHGNWAIWSAYTVSFLCPIPSPRALLRTSSSWRSCRYLNDEFPPCTTRRRVLQSFDGLIEWIDSFDHGSYLSSIDHATNVFQLHPA